MSVNAFYAYHLLDSARRRAAVAVYHDARSKHLVPSKEASLPSDGKIPACV